MDSWQWRETQQLERERARLESAPAPQVWDRGSWIRGAMYALAWVICRRGAELPPLEAASRLIGDPPAVANESKGDG